jgi:hypothetical protein
MLFKEIVAVRSEAFTATEVDKICSGYQPCQLVKNLRPFRATSVIFNQLTRLITVKDFIEVIAVIVRTVRKRRKR